MSTSRTFSRRALMSASLTLGGAAAMTAALGACAAAPVAQPATTQPVQSEATAAPPQQTSEPITIEVWYNKYATEETWRSIYDEFEEANPGIKVKEQGIPYGEHEQKILTTVAGGMVVDLVFTHPVSNATLASRGAIVPLDDFLSGSGRDLDDFYPGASAYYRYKDKLWGISYYSGPWLIYYNTALVEAAGLEDPMALYGKGEWSRDKFVEYAAALTKGEGMEKVYGCRRLNAQLDISCIFIWGEGGDIWNADALETLVNSDAGVAAFTFMADLVLNGYAPHPADEAAFGQIPGGIFGSEKAAISHCARFCTLSWDGAPVADKLAMVPWFAQPDGSEYSIDGPNALGIFTKSEHKQEAWDVLWHTATRGNEVLMVGGFTCPTRRAVAEGDLWKSILRPWESAEVYSIAASNVKALFQPPGFVEITQLINTAYEDMLGGEESVKQILDRVKPKIDEILQEMAV